MKVQDNFLDEFEFNNLRESILSDGFPWFSSTVLSGYDKYQLVHSFYEGTYGDHFSLVTPLLHKMKVAKVDRIKANSQEKTDTIIEHPFHVDGPVVCETSIFYLNTCDGYTKFENGAIVNSVANRLVTFPSQTKHCGTTCTNDSRRLVINFNYFI